MLRVFSSFLSLAIAGSAATLPLYFEPNVLDSQSRVQFLSRGNGVTSYLAGPDAMFTVGKSGVSMKLKGAHPALGQGAGKLGGTTSYFLGADPKSWRTGVPQYARVVYHDIYPGIDLIYYGSHGNLEYDFRVAPGGDPGKIRIAYQGGRARIDQQGDLIVTTPGGDLRQRRPQVYQDINHRRKRIDASYRIEPDNTVALTVATYNHGQTLVIDPVLQYATYFGGNGPDSASAVKVDAAGNVYIAGSIATPQSTADPFNAASGSPYSNTTAAVIKFSPSDNSIQYVAQVGGDGQNFAAHLAVDGAGAVYLTGETNSRNFPAVNAVDGTNRAGSSFTPFVTKINPDGQSIAYSTYFGGSGPFDHSGGIAVDANGAAYVTGQCGTSDFPLTDSSVTAAQGSKAFLAKFAPDGSLAFSKLFGSTTGSAGTAIALDSSSNIYVVGTTTAVDFPTKNAFQSSFFKDPVTAPILGLHTAFATKFSSDGSNVIYSTLFGGSGDDQVNGAAVDAQGNLYIAGSTTSFDLAMVNPVQSTSGGAQDGFVAELGSQGNSLLFSTYLGGLSDDAIQDLALDAAGNIYVAGSTTSSDIPLASSARSIQKDQSAVRIRSVFAAKLAASGKGIVYATVLGGSEDDNATGIAVDRNGSAFVVGMSNSPDFPVTNAFQANYGGNTDMFLARIDADGDAASSLAISPVSLNFTMVDGGPAPAPQMLDISGTADFSASSAGDWLFVTPGDGSAPGQVAVAVNSMAAGSYAGSVQVTPQDGSSQITVPVSFRVIPPTPVLSSVNPTHFPSLTFDQLSSSTPASVTLTITGSGFAQGAIASVKNFPYAATQHFPLSVIDSGTAQLTLPVTSQAVPISITVSNPGTPASNALNVMQGSVTPAISSVLNDASKKPSVNAGDVVDILGNNLGPVLPFGVAKGNVVTQLGDTQVFFDGAPAQILLAYDFGLRVIAPSSIAGKQQTKVVVTFLGQSSSPFTVGVAGATAPPLDPFGPGVSGIVNQDGSINSATNPAAIGSCIEIMLDVQQYPASKAQLDGITIGGAAAASYCSPSFAIGIAGKWLTWVRVPSGIQADPALPLVVRFVNPAGEVDLPLAIQ